MPNLLYTKKGKLLVIFHLLFVLLTPSQAQHKKKATLDIPAKSLNFIILGDWGRYGDDHQVQVAEQMAKTAKEVTISFFISTGDNFYPKGVASVNDPHWHYSFEEIYKDFALQKEWYAILGNHDYMGDPDAQVAYTKVSRRWEMPARYFAETFSLRDDSGKKVRIAFIDTNPLIAAFYENPEYGPNVRTQDTTAQKLWLEKVLTKDQEDISWNLVTGHHPMFTGSDKRREGYDTKAIRSSLNVFLEEKNADAYIAGHDHSLQHLQPEGSFHHFISGSASEATQVGSIPYSKFAASAYGFLVFSLTSSEMIVHAISHSGEVLYRTEIKKQ